MLAISQGRITQQVKCQAAKGLCAGWHFRLRLCSQANLNAISRETALCQYDGMLRSLRYRSNPSGEFCSLAASRTLMVRITACYDSGYGCENPPPSEPIMCNLADRGPLSHHRLGKLSSVDMGGTACGPQLFSRARTSLMICPVQWGDCRDQPDARPLALLLDTHHQVAFCEKSGNLWEDDE